MSIKTERELLRMTNEERDRYLGEEIPSLRAKLRRAGIDIQALGDVRYGEASDSLLARALLPVESMKPERSQALALNFFNYERKSVSYERYVDEIIAERVDKALEFGPIGHFSLTGVINSISDGQMVEDVLPHVDFDTMPEEAAYLLVQRLAFAEYQRSVCYVIDRTGVSYDNMYPESLEELRNMQHYIIEEGITDEVNDSVLRFGINGLINHYADRLTMTTAIFTNRNYLPVMTQLVEIDDHALRRMAVNSAIENLINVITQRDYPTREYLKVVGDLPLIDNEHVVTTILLQTNELIDVMGDENNRRNRTRRFRGRRPTNGSRTQVHTRLPIGLRAYQQYVHTPSYGENTLNQPLFERRRQHRNPERAREDPDRVADKVAYLMNHDRYGELDKVLLGYDVRDMRNILLSIVPEVNPINLYGYIEYVALEMPLVQGSEFRVRMLNTLYRKMNEEQREELNEYLENIGHSSYILK